MSPEFGSRPALIEDSAAPIRVLHLTDPHLFADRNSRLRGRVTYASLDGVISHYLDQDWRADFVALTGDVIQDDSREAYGHCRDLLTKVGLPVHCVPGNHDIRPLMRDMLDGPPFVYCGSAEFGNWLVVCLDSCVDGEAGGAVPQDEMERMDDLIAGSRATHVLVCLHHPPVPMGSAWLDSVGLANGEQFLDRMQESGRVRIGIVGHVHQQYDADLGGVRIIATPSTCSQFKPRSEEFTVDDLPPAYRRIELHADGQIGTELQWVDSDA